MRIKEFEAKLSAMEVTTYNQPNEVVERGDFPIMAAVFDKLEHPCSQEDFYSLFRETYYDQYRKLFSTELEMATRTRLHKSYLSLERDTHFELLLRSNFHFVLKSLELDKAGVDFLVIEQFQGSPINFTLHCYMDTANSLKFMREKYGRTKYNLGIRIDVPIGFQGPYIGKRIGKFLLYGQSHINLIKEKIGEYERGIDSGVGGGKSG